jgi:hypothetical protein
MHLLLPLTFLLTPVALAFPKYGFPHPHGEKPHWFPYTVTAEEVTSFATLTIPSTLANGVFPTGTGVAFGSGTAFSYPTAFPTGAEFKKRDVELERRAVLEGRQFGGFPGFTFTGTGVFPTGTGFAKPTGF